MFIGIDFDNTIVSYDSVMSALAVEEGVVAEGTVASKRHIRDTLRRLPSGEKKWRRMQALAYGVLMREATLIDGVADFFRTAHRRGVPVVIISHKSKRAAADTEGVDLQDRARRWMERHRFFSDPTYGLSPRDVFFEPTREKKIERIIATGCTHFIDDLVETFCERIFPPGVEKILFAADKPDDLPSFAAHYSSWKDIRNHFFAVERNPDDLIAVVEKLLTIPVEKSIALRGGGNSRVTAVTLVDGSRCVAKKYFDATIEGADRLVTEVQGLNYLWAAGIDQIPQPLAWDAGRQVALFSFVEGEPVTMVTDDDIRQLAAFLLRLAKLSSTPDALSQPNAAAASLRPDSLISQIQGRLERFDSIAIDSPQQQALRSFLDTDFIFAFDRIMANTEEGLRRQGRSLTDPLPRSALVLSPSDVGFHNALRRPDGSLVFLDFEYFGWDDPAKMILDVLLHPGMSLSLDQKKLFFDIMIEALGREKPQLRTRVETLLPLVGLKWICILLNEFVPRDRQRRQFAASRPDHPEEINRTLVRQLDRAKTRLNDLCDETGPLWELCAGE